MIMTPLENNHIDKTKSAPRIANFMLKLPSKLTVFDTETTGTGKDALIVSYGSVELDLITNEISDHFEIFVDPELSEEEIGTYEEYAYKVTNIAIPGMTNCDAHKFVDKRAFTETICARLRKIENMIAHNATFDKRMLDQTLLLETSFLESLEIELFCSLQLSRKTFDKDQVGSFSLDSLCTHTGVDNSSRKFHGALLDAELTAEYLIKINERNLLDIRS